MQIIPVNHFTSIELIFKENTKMEVLKSNILIIITFFMLTSLGPIRETMKGESSMIVALLTTTDAFKYFKLQRKGQEEKK